MADNTQNNKSSNSMDANTGSIWVRENAVILGHQLERNKIQAEQMAEEGEHSQLVDKKKQTHPGTATAPELAIGKSSDPIIICRKWSRSPFKAKSPASTVASLETYPLDIGQKQTVSLQRWEITGTLEDRASSNSNTVDADKPFVFAFSNPPPTHELCSRSPTSLASSDTQQCESPSTSPKATPRQRQEWKRPLSREKRRKRLLGMKSWRSGTAVAKLPELEPFVPPKAEEIQAAMNTIAVAIPDKMRNIVSAVLEQQQQQYSLVGEIHPFRPSYPALQRMGLLSNLDKYRSSVSSSFGVSSNYLGDVSVPENRSANIPEVENCSLWLTNLPAEVSYQDLLQSIRGFGKVFATFINPASGQHRTAAAKVVLFDRKSAETLFNMAQDGSFCVLDSPVQVRWNRIKVAAQSNRYSKHSRAIRITGPTELMDFEFFEIYFKTLFKFQLDRRFVVPCESQGKISHEWHFSSFRCQAQHAKAVIERELKPTFDVEWARDPCQ